MTPLQSLISTLSEFAASGPCGNDTRLAGWMLELAKVVGDLHEATEDNARVAEHEMRQRCAQERTTMRVAVERDIACRERDTAITDRDSLESQLTAARAERDRVSEMYKAMVDARDQLRRDRDTAVENERSARTSLTSTEAALEDSRKKAELWRDMYHAQLEGHMQDVHRLADMQRQRDAARLERDGWERQCNEAVQKMEGK